MTRQAALNGCTKLEPVLCAFLKSKQTAYDTSTLKTKITTPLLKQTDNQILHWSYKKTADLILLGPPIFKNTIRL